MSPDEALEEQLSRYRAMTGEERLLIVMTEHELLVDCLQRLNRWAAELGVAEILEDTLAGRIRPKTT